MQLAKVVIASALVLAACAEGLPEGKGLMYYRYIHLPHIMMVGLKSMP